MEAVGDEVMMGEVVEDDIMFILGTECTLLSWNQNFLHVEEDVDEA